MTTLFYFSYALLWALVVFHSLILLGLARTAYGASAGPVPDTAPASSGALVGRAVPAFAAIDVFGKTVDQETFAGRLSAWLFVTPGCRTCMASLEEINALHSKVDGSLAVVCRAGFEECKRLRETYDFEDVRVIVDEDRKVSELFGVSATPTAVLIGANGRVRTYGHPMDKDEFARLIGEGDTSPDLQEAY